MNKRGLQNELGGIVLWIVILVVLLFTGSKVLTAITTSNNENQAKSTIERFANFISDIKEGESASFIIYSPKDFYFVPSGALVCICEATNCNEAKIKACKTIAKPLEYSGSPIRISLGTLRVSNQIGKYLLETDIIQTTDEKDEVIQITTTGECSGELVNVQGLQMMSSVKPIFDNASEIAKSKGIELQIISAFRTPAQQRELWEAKGKNPILVCDPDTTQGICPHQTGCSLDVCIGDLCKKDKPHTQADMQLLQDIMTEAGFVRYQAEYWHFEYGTSRWQTCKNSGQVVCS